MLVNIASSWSSIDLNFIAQIRKLLTSSVIFSTLVFEQVSLLLVTRRVDDNIESLVSITVISASRDSYNGAEVVVQVLTLR